MSRITRRRLAALLSAVALAVTGVTVTAGADGAVVAGICCDMHPR